MEKPQAIEIDSIELTRELEEKHILERVKGTLQAIFDGIEDGIFVINRDYEVIRTNKAVLNIFGKRDFREILGKKCFSELYQRATICDDCPAEKTFEEGTTNQLTKISREIGKKEVILDKSTFPIKDENGNAIQVIEYIKDVTQMVKLENRLLHSERLSGIGKLAAGIAHEIRNPLSSIKAAAQLCLSKYEPDEWIKRHLKIIVKNSEKMNRVIEDLLNLARPHKTSLKIGNVDKVIEGVCSLVNARCLKQNVDIVKRLQTGLPQIFLDEKLLESAFLNLILNALDAMPRGGRLAIAAYYDPDAKEIITTLADSGHGISEDNLKMIFDPFFTTKKAGTGLGLSLARQVIELHRGNIYIESKLGYGTEVTARLPVK